LGQVLPKLFKKTGHIVKRVFLSDIKIGKEAISEILSDCARLEELSLNGLDIEDTTLIPLTIKANPELRRLSLENCKKITTDGLWPVVKNSPSLSSMRLIGTLVDRQVFMEYGAQVF
jgi:hypothetical protein